MVTCAVGSGTLWPPNHDLIAVGFAATAADNCDGPGSIGGGTSGGGLPMTVTVLSNEPELAQGSGNFSPDAKFANGVLRLRSERSGNGDGRIYLILSSGTDSAGNLGWCSSTVTVTHDQSAASRASVEAKAAAAKAWYLNYKQPPTGWYVIGNGAIVGPKQ